MSIIFPIEGAGTEPPLVHVTSILAGFESKGRTYEACARAGFEVQGETSRAAFLAATIGAGRRRAVLSALDTGAPLSARLAAGLEVTGERALNVRATLESSLAPTISDVLASLHVRRESARGGFSLLTGAHVNGQTDLSVFSSLHARQQSFQTVRATLEATTPKSGRFLSALETGNLRAARFVSAADIETAEGLDILVDIISDVIERGSNGELIDLTARMFINGVEKPYIGSFSFQAPPQALGTRVDIVLTREVINEFPPDALVSFDIGVTSGGQIEFVRLVENGRLAGRGLDLSATDTGSPNDRLNISVVNVLADRWQLRPETPFILYNPATVKASEVKVDQGNLIRDDLTGRAIQTTVRAQPGLTMRRVLSAAYVDGCGFGRVITNLPDFPVDRADFPVSAGFHDVARGLIDIFDPVMFADDANILFIIDPERPLPPGFVPRALPLGAVIDPAWTRPARNFQNAVLLSYRVSKESANADLRTRIDFEQDAPITSGRFGEPDYSETFASRRIRRTYNVHDPETILSETEIETNESIYAMRGGAFVEIHRETQVDEFDARGLKIGHRKTIDALVDSPEHGGAIFQNVLEEINYTEWTVDPDDFDLFLLKFSETKIAGLVLVEPEATPDGTDRRTPILQADENRIIDVASDQRTERAAIKTIRETLRPKGGVYVGGGSAEQFEIHTIVINELTGTTVPQRSQPRTGSRSASGAANRNRTILLRDRDSEEEIGLRVPVPVSGGVLPEEMALEYGRKFLLRLSRGRMEWTTGLPGLSLSARKGSIYAPDDRDGETGNYLVTGLSITGTPIKDDFFDIVMTMQGVELQNVE